MKQAEWGPPGRDEPSLMVPQLWRDGSGVESPSASQPHKRHRQGRPQLQGVEENQAAPEPFCGRRVGGELRSVCGQVDGGGGWTDARWRGRCKERVEIQMYGGREEPLEDGIGCFGG